MPYLGYEDEEFPGGRFSRMPCMEYEDPLLQGVVWSRISQEDAVHGVRRPLLQGMKNFPKRVC